MKSIGHPITPGFKELRNVTRVEGCTPLELRILRYTVKDF